MTLIPFFPDIPFPLSELGGKSPVIVFDSADLDSAVEGVVDAIWFNQGQVRAILLMFMPSCGFRRQHRKLLFDIYVQLGM